MYLRFTVFLQDLLFSYPAINNLNINVDGKESSVPLDNTISKYDLPEIRSGSLVELSLWEVNEGERTLYGVKRAFTATESLIPFIPGGINVKLSSKSPQSILGAFSATGEAPVEILMAEADLKPVNKTNTRSRPKD